MHVLWGRCRVRRARTSPSLHLKLNASCAASKASSALQGVQNVSPGSMEQFRRGLVKTLKSSLETAKEVWSTWGWLSLSALPYGDAGSGAALVGYWSQQVDG